MSNDITEVILPEIAKEKTPEFGEPWEIQQIAHQDFSPAIVDSKGFEYFAPLMQSDKAANEKRRLATERILLLVNLFSGVSTAILSQMYNNPSTRQKLALAVLRHDDEVAPLMGLIDDLQENINYSGVEGQKTNEELRKELFEIAFILSHEPYKTHGSLRAEIRQRIYRFLSIHCPECGGWGRLGKYRTDKLCPRCEGIGLKDIPQLKKDALDSDLLNDPSEEPT
jgi:hypothetical protein